MDENHGFDVFVVADATAIFDGTLVEDYFDAEVIPRAAFAQFFDEYAISMSTEDAIWNI